MHVSPEAPAIVVSKRFGVRLDVWAGMPVPWGSMGSFPAGPSSPPSAVGGRCPGRDVHPRPLVPG